MAGVYARSARRRTVRIMQTKIRTSPPPITKRATIINTNSDRGNRTMPSSSGQKHTMMRDIRTNEENNCRERMPCGERCLCAYSAKSRNVEHLVELNVCTTNIEAQWLKLVFPETRPTYIVNIYKPPTGNVAEGFDQIQSTMHSLQTNSIPDFVLMGDINVDLLKPSANRKTVTSFMNNMGLTQLVKSATRSTNSGQSLIDHIYINNADYYVNAIVVDPGLSDHSMTCTNRRRPKLKHQRTYMYGRSYRDFVDEVYCLDVACLPWGVLYAIQDLNIAAELLTNMIKTVANLHAPIKRIKIRANQPEWITGDFLSLLDTKEHWANVHRKRPSTYTVARKREAMREVARTKRILERGYILEAIESCKGDSGKTWKLLKTLWPTKSTANNINKIGNCTSADEVANSLNTHFSSVGSTLDSAIPGRAVAIMGNPNPNTAFNFERISLTEVFDILKAIKPSKSCSVDRLTAHLIKSCYTALVKPLHHVFNLCITYDTFPDIWKCARITPLYKDGSRTDASNYRPISVLPILGKCLERLIHNRRAT